MDQDWLPLLTAGACAIAVLWLVTPDKRVAVMPSPKSTLPILGNTLDFAVFQFSRIYDWLADESARHEGRPWRLKLLGKPPIVVVATAEAFEDVMKTQFEIFDKGETLRYLLKDPAGNGIASVDGEEWKAQRRVLAHLFTMRAFRETIADSVIENVRLLGKVIETQMKTNLPLDFSLTCQRFTYDTFVKIGFGIESRTLTEGQDGIISEFLDAIGIGVQMRMSYPTALWKLQRWLGVGAQGNLMRCIKSVDKVVYGIVNECLRRRAEAAETSETASRKVNDIVSMFVDLYAQESSITKVLKIDPVFLRDTGVNMLFAGRDTTASAMVWCNLMLNRYPEVHKRVRDELHNVLPRLFDERDYVPNMDDVDLLIYMEAFIRETLRLYPIGPLNMRQANRDTTLSDGTFIAKGTQVFTPSYSLGRMKTVWGEDALEFKPERWIEIGNNTDKPTIRKISPFQFPAFHAGPRVCIGKRFALLELKTALAYLLSKYELRTVKDPSSYSYTSALTLTLDSPMMVHVLPAEKADAA